jgi:hypothetical protein
VRPLLPAPLRRACSIVLLSLSFLVFLAPMHALYGESFYARTFLGRAVCSSIAGAARPPTWLLRC